MYSLHAHERTLTARTDLIKRAILPLARVDSAQRTRIHAPLSTRVRVLFYTSTEPQNAENPLNKLSWSSNLISLPRISPLQHEVSSSVLSLACVHVRIHSAQRTRRHAQQTMRVCVECEYTGLAQCAHAGPSGCTIIRTSPLTESSWSPLLSPPCLQRE